MTPCSFCDSQAFTADAASGLRYCCEHWSEYREIGSDWDGYGLTPSEQMAMKHSEALVKLRADRGDSDE